MNKSDVVNAMADKTGMTKKDAQAALEAFLEVMKETLKKNEKITLTGAFTLTTTKRKARTGRNPRTGEEIKIPAKNVVKFTPGSEFKSAAAE